MLERSHCALRAAWRNLDPASATAPCPVTLPALPLIRGEDGDPSAADREALDVARWRMSVVDASAILGDPPPPDEKMMQEIEREVATRGPRRDQFERQSKMLERIAKDGKVSLALVAVTMSASWTSPSDKGHRGASYFETRVSLKPRAASSAMMPRGPGKCPTPTAMNASPCSRILSSSGIQLALRL